MYTLVIVPYSYVLCACVNHRVMYNVNLMQSSFIDVIHLNLMILKFPESISICDSVGGCV